MKYIPDVTKAKGDRMALASLPLPEALLWTSLEFEPRLNGLTSLLCLRKSWGDDAWDAVEVWPMRDDPVDQRGAMEGNGVISRPLIESMFALRFIAAGFLFYEEVVPWHIFDSM